MQSLARIRDHILIFCLLVGLTFTHTPAQQQTEPLKQHEPTTRDFVSVGESIGSSTTNGERVLPELWAIVVGISHYKYGDQSIGDVRIRNLRYATRDAEAVYDFLISENGGFQKDHVRKLVNEDATKANVEAALFQFLKQAREQDYVFLFFASHGAYPPEQSGPNQTPYLILYDTHPQRIAETGLGVDVIGRALKQLPARKGLFISDACHSGGLEFASGRSSNDEARVRSYLREQVAASKEGIVYLSAANSVEKSYEYPELEHGVFTYYLLEGLRGNARGSRADVITIRDLWIYVQKRVAERTENRQHPTLGQNRYDPDLVVSVLPRKITGQPTSIDTSKTTEAIDGTLTITIRDEDQVEVTIDGKPIEGGKLDSDKTVSLVLPAGSHLVQATKGTRVFRKEVTINPGKTTPLPIRLPLPLAEPSPKTKEKFQEGVRLLEQFKIDAAIARFNEVVALEPRFPDVYAYIGRAELKARRLEKALAAYDKALELDPNNTRTLVLKAEVLLEQGDLGGAQTLLKQAVNEDPEDGFAPLVLGYSYYLENRFDAAEEQLQTAVNRDPTNPLAYLQLANVQRARGTRDLAITMARKAITLFHDFPKQQERANAWKAILMSTKLRTFLDQSNLAEAHLLLGVLLLEQAELNRSVGAKLPSEAVEQIEKAYQYAQSSNNRLLLAHVIYYRAEIYSKAQEYDRAINGYLQALENNRELANPYRGLSWCYEKQQKFQAALDNYEKYVERLNKSEYDAQRDQIERRRKRLKEQVRAHAKQ
ncbi:MAG: caspase family protein [Acidobacteriota bacterium]